MVAVVQFHRRVMIVVGLFLFLVAIPSFIHGQSVAGSDAEPNWATTLQEYWVFRLFLNLLGYATIVVPGFFIIKYIRQSNYVEKSGNKGCVPFCVRLCVYGQEEEKATVEEAGVAPDTTPPPKPPQTFCVQCMSLCWCAGGLLGSYLIWGLLQERIMAFEYGKTDTEPGEKFKNSQFLVFMNRILAFIVASTYIVATRQPRHSAPLYKYSYSSFSNIMSSWCQYEALKFVSFPVQVLAKASKVIPVMLMGKIVSKKTYQLYEYITAVFISVGVAIFMLASEQEEGHNSTTISGIIILIGYLTFDAFTSNWQGELFKQHHMTSMQMMAGVNLFSVVFTTVSLVEQGGFIESVAFMTQYPTFIAHIIVLAITSATGQLFIFHTINKFGAVTFTIIMTIRQGVAILLSCIIYVHPVHFNGLVGIALVFGAVIARIYLGEKSKKKPAPRPSAEPVTTVVAPGPAMKA